MPLVLGIVLTDFLCVLQVCVRFSALFNDCACINGQEDTCQPEITSTVWLNSVGAVEKVTAFPPGVEISCCSSELCYDCNISAL